LDYVLRTVTVCHADFGRISVIIAGILGVVAQHITNATPANQTFLAGGSFPIMEDTENSGVLSCSNISTQTDPFLFPNQNITPFYINFNGLKTEALNFHIEPFQIGNIFQGSSVTLFT